MDLKGKGWLKLRVASASVRSRTESMPVSSLYISFSTTFSFQSKFSTCDVLHHLHFRRCDISYHVAHIALFCENCLSCVTISFRFRHAFRGNGSYYFIASYFFSYWLVEGSPDLSPRLLFLLKPHFCAVWRHSAGRVMNFSA